MLFLLVPWIFDGVSSFDVSFYVCIVFVAVAVFDVCIAFMFVLQKLVTKEDTSLKSQVSWQKNPKVSSLSSRDTILKSQFLWHKSQFSWHKSQVSVLVTQDAASLVTSLISCCCLWHKKTMYFHIFLLMLLSLFIYWTKTEIVAFILNASFKTSRESNSFSTHSHCFF